MKKSTVQIDPKFDLVLERVVDVPPATVWAAWTKPEYLKQWFCPAPWKTVAAEVDLRPGGKFATTMQSPEGQQFPNEGCYLEVVENEKLVWTSAMAPGYRPRNPPEGQFNFTAVILMEAHGKGTKYTAIAIHSDEEGRDKHDKMGFHVGWGAALDQLVELAKKM
ncbi:MAG: SRPBCC family protein [Bdellovibrionota bacterium]